MGKGESGEGRLHRREAGQEHHIGCWQKENRGRTAGAVGEGEGAAEEGGVAALGACCVRLAAFSLSEISRQHVATEVLRSLPSGI